MTGLQPPSGTNRFSSVNIFSSFLPAHVLAKSFSDKNGQHDRLSDYNVLSESSNVAIVGWEALPSNIHHSKKRAERIIDLVTDQLVEIYELES